MKNIILILFSISILFAETLFEVKDASNKKVLDVSTDGLRVMNDGDTLMVISPSGVRVNLLNVPDKALSRTFAVTTTASKNKGLNRVLEVGTESTTMREGDLGERYTDFSPSNIFLGLNSGIVCTGASNVFIGNKSGRNTTWGSRNIFLGNQAGENAMCNASILIGEYAGISMGVTDLAEYNIAIGQSAGSTAAGYGNIFIGPYAGRTAKGNENNYLGSEAGNKTTTGYGNVFLGSKAGLSNLTGYSNVFVGNSSGSSNSAGYGNVMIGTSAGSGETGSNKLYIANSNTSTPLIKGNFPNTDLTLTANTVTVAHATGTSYGLYIKNKENTNDWHFYQYSTGRLGLFYNGSYRGEWNIDTGAYTFTSDRRLKQNISEIGRVSDKIAKIEPKTYNYIGQTDMGKKYTGLIAQEVADIFPEFVSYNEEEDIYTIDYAGLSVIALQGIKEQQSKISGLEAENRDLLSRIEAIEALLKK
jgi:trimeric autotransporter adhesin